MIRCELWRREAGGAASRVRRWACRKCVIPRVVAYMRGCFLFWNSDFEDWELCGI